MIQSTELNSESFSIEHSIIASTLQHHFGNNSVTESTVDSLIDLSTQNNQKDVFFSTVLIQDETKSQTLHTKETTTRRNNWFESTLARITKPRTSTLEQKQSSSSSDLTTLIESTADSTNVLTTKQHQNNSFDSSFSIEIGSQRQTFTAKETTLGKNIYEEIINHEHL